MGEEKRGVALDKVYILVYTLIGGEL